MLTVLDYAVRQNSEGEPFVALMLQGDLEMVQSQETGRLYATARKCSIPSTFSEQVAKQMIGQKTCYYWSSDTQQRIRCCYNISIKDHGHCIESECM